MSGEVMFYSVVWGCWHGPKACEAQTNDDTVTQPSGTDS